MKKSTVLCMAFAAIAFFSCDEKKQDKADATDTAKTEAPVDSNMQITDSLKNDSSADMTAEQNTENQTDAQLNQNPQAAGQNANKGPLPELKKAVEEYEKKLENAKSMKEVMALGQDMAFKIAELQSKYPDYQPTPEEEAENMALQERYHNAAMKASQKYASEFKESMMK